MRSLPEPYEKKKIEGDSLALQIWEDVVQSMSQFTDDSIFSKFTPPEELLAHIRPIAAAFAQLHFTPLPPMKVVYKSDLYSIFYFSIIAGVQIFIRQRSILKNHQPYTVRTAPIELREAKNLVMKQLTEGIKVFPPVNQIMDIFLNHTITERRLERLPLKHTEFDSQKFNKFMPVTLLWGYLFANEVIIDQAFHS